ncbi:MAG TPA: rhodanese-like domain-containing protein [Blastocatellia bacterium]|nr:rhodanese-like domain-containing protein [Blastocatellia bacterium]
MSLKRWQGVLFLSASILLSWAVAVGMPSSASAAGADEKAESIEIERITVDELKSKFAGNEPVVILDVRGGDYDASQTKIKGAIRIPPADLEAHLKEIPRDKEVVTYCACSTDGGAVKAARILRANGFNRVRALKGGWTAWNQAGGAVEPK